MRVHSKRVSSTGFSLVELVVVMAMLAIMVGVSGILVLPYIEKSRAAKDYQVVSGLCTAATTAFSENAATLVQNNSYTIQSTTSASDVWNTPNADVVQSIRDLLGSNLSTDKIISLLLAEFESKEAKAATSVTIDYKVDGTVVVRLFDSSSKPIFDPVSSK